MNIIDEKLFVKNAIFKVVDLDADMETYCETYSEFEFYSMYDAVVRDLWERTNTSFDSYEEFLNYCYDYKKEALNLRAAKYWNDFTVNAINNKKEKLFDLD